MTTATVILHQLGGSRFLAMTGAKDFVGGEDFLTFRLPSRFAKDGINRVTVMLDPSDTYTMIFAKQRGTNISTLRRVPYVYADRLQDCFTRTTGLNTHL